MPGMEFSAVVHRRRMVRAFRADEPVPKQVVHRVLEHAARAPSAGFTQGFDFLVLTSAGQRDTFWASTTDPQAAPDAWLRGVGTAPVLILCLAHPQAYLDRYAEPDKERSRQDMRDWPIPYWDVDTGMAALLMLLTATDEGLGSLFFGVPAAAMGRVKEAFAIPADRRIVGVVALGYPDPDVPPRAASSRRDRRPLSQQVHRGTFGTPWSATAQRAN